MAAAAGAARRALRRLAPRALRAGAEVQPVAGRRFGALAAAAQRAAHRPEWSSAALAERGCSQPRGAQPGRGFAAAASLPPHTQIPMPSLSPTMSQGNISKWRKREGDKVAAGDVLAEIETDKATMEMEAMEDGFVAKILKPDGAQNVAVGEPVLLMVEDAGDVAAFASYSASAAAPPPQPAAAAPAAAAPPPPPPPPPRSATAAPPLPRSNSGVGATGRVVASPLAKKTAADAGFSLAGVVGTGPGGRILRADVVEAMAAHAALPPGARAAAAAAAPAAGPSALDAFFPDYTDHSISNIKKVTAKRLQESKQTVPHFYLSVDVRMDALLAARAKLNGAPGAAHKISVNDLMIKAAALACARVPEVNAAWLGDKIRRYAAVDVSVAVQTDAGLMVPIVRGADTKGLAAISADVKALAAKAREGKLVPAEFVGGTFTISNLGMMGVKSFAAIINPPQAAILAVGATRPEVVAAPGGGYAEAKVLTATLSCDHRVVDGAVGAAWLAAFKGCVEDPMTMLL